MEEINVAATIGAGNDLITASEELTDYLEEYYSYELKEYERS
jgi:hypothetical protein